ncbi:hypothetical protein [Streptomyces sp. Isolate_45]|uniref:hypothetical protein n=1 Tax=Streptomyces sp. Isolate_45 TaxID=2950111 RepID=UPI0024819956|nr:hypothetical protein [Streptomyces sp. Isolate_45]MDA5285924.1 hypothetical protein [Streptomyces sp. Isolate_45]
MERQLAASGHLPHLAIVAKVVIEFKRVTATLAVALVGAATLTPPSAAAGISPYEPTYAGPRAASSLEAPAGATVTEGQVKEVASGGVITYPSVTSCLTVTVRLRSGGLAGAHASLFRVPGELRSDEILGALKQLVGGRPVAAIEVRGAVGAWHPSYFVKAPESYGEGERVPIPEGPDFNGIAQAVSRGLGLPRGLVTVEDVPDGDQIIR